MGNFFTMEHGGKLCLPKLGNYCLKYRPVGWDYDVVEVRDKYAQCIDVYRLA